MACIEFADGVPIENERRRKLNRLLRSLSLNRDTTRAISTVNQWSDHSHPLNESPRGQSIRISDTDEGDQLS